MAGINISKHFFTDDKILIMLRKKIYEQVIKTITPSIMKTQIQKKNKCETQHKSILKHSTAIYCNTFIPDSEDLIIKELISSFLSDPSASTLSPLIGIHIVYKNGNLKFTNERSNDDIQKLKHIDISPITVDEAEVIAVRNILSPLKLKVPNTFGNSDLTIGGNDEKVKKRLNTLCNLIESLCKKSQLSNSYKIVSMDENMGEGYLSHNGGISGMVGNLLVYDNATKLLKFTEKPNLLKNNARTLFDNLNCKILDLPVYRLDVKAVVSLPKLVFDFTDEAADLLNKVVIYEQQSNHIEVEELLKKEIEKQQTREPSNFQVKSDIIVIQYHNEIQKWWMSPKMGKYFTKSCNIYRQAINNIVSEPQISAMQTTFNMNNMKYFGYDFSENVISSLILAEIDLAAIIITDITTLTAIKVIRYLRNKYVVLDLECVLNLPGDQFSALKAEIINIEKILVVICDSTKHNRTLHKRLDELAQATESKKIIIVTNHISVGTVQEYFSKAKIIYDKELSLFDLTLDTQKDVLKQATVIFQGQKVGLDVLIQDESIKFINGTVFSKILRNETITIGEPLSNSSYEEIKHLYINRRINRSSNYQDLGDYVVYFNHGDTIRSFHDIKEDVVLLASGPGMGKSTLLTHLSLKTKEVDENIWIVRINLLDHSKIFFKWQKEKAIIDTMEILKFMCSIILKNNDTTICLKEINDKMYLERCTGDELATFELNMFLHFYNKRRLIFLLDGFDEICPNYKNNIIKVLNVIKNFPGKHKMWVTSRPYSDILPDLEYVLGESYYIEYMDKMEQEVYLNSIWFNKLIFEDLSDDHIHNIISLSNFTSDTKRRVKDMKLNMEFISLFAFFNEFICSQYPRVQYTHVNVPPLKKSNASNQKFNISIMIDEVVNRNELCTRPLDKFIGTPLHLYLLADYIVHLVCVNETVKSWDININIYNIYEMFVETKLKTVLFQDKNKTDITKPDVMRRCEKEITDCITMHKRLAAYSIFKDLFDNEDFVDELKDMLPFKFEDSEELDAMINVIKSGTEKTGLISHVTEDNVPTFTHRTFEEYFAAEYMYDIFKSDKYELRNKSNLLSLLLYYELHNGWLKHKLKVDKEFAFIYDNLCLELSIFRSHCPEISW